MEKYWILNMVRPSRSEKQVFTEPAAQSQNYLENLEVKYTLQRQ